MLKLVRVKYNQLLMMRDRGYVIDHDPYINLLTYQFSELGKILENFEKKRDELRKLFTQEYRHKGTERKCLVYYWTEPGNSVSKSVISDLAEMVVTTKINDAIIITDKKLSPPANAQLGELNNFISHFLEKELVYNPLNAAIVPPHRLLTEKEAAQVFENSTVSKTNLPLIRTTDPVIKWLDGQPGQVVEIKRRIFGVQSTMCPDTLVYRLIVKWN